MNIDRSRSLLPRPGLPFAVWVAVSLLLAWTLLMCSVPWPQDFPLGDDFAFAHGAMGFARGTGVHYGHHASMPLLGQWVWATPFLWLGSQWPHVALRISTIVLGGLGLWAFYDLLTHDGFDSGQAGFLTGVLAFNPLYFLLQGTFMSDVPALAFALIALALYRRAMDTERLLTLVGASLAAILGVSTRQNAIAAPLAIAVVAGLRADIRGRWTWQVAVALPILVGLGVHRWFISRRDIWPIEATLQLNMTFLAMWAIVAQIVGLLVLPVLLQSAFRPAGPTPYSSRVANVVFPVACLLTSVGLIYWGKHLSLVQKVVPGDGLQPWFPYTMPMLGPYGPFSAVLGFGPLYLPVEARQILTVVGIFAAGAVTARLIAKPFNRLYSSPVIVYSMIQALMFILAPKIYDRYFVVLLPGVMAAIAARTGLSIARRGVGWIALAAMSIFSVALMHDWLSWNEARWTLGKKAITSGIHPWEIEGGLEWNGWYGPDNQPDLPPASGALPEMIPQYNFDLRFFHIIDRYSLGAEQPADMRVRDYQPYTVWLPPGKRRFMLLEHTTAGASQGSAPIDRPPDHGRAFP